MTKIKVNNFKAGNIILHSVNIGKDIYEYSPFDNEKRFVRKEVQIEQETLLIIGRVNNSFIVTPLGPKINAGAIRKYYSYGGFDNCFNMMAKYVNENCSLVS